jgi:predicted small secreted protein
MRRYLWGLLMLAFAGAGALSLAACNTVEGAGRDVSATGHAISNTAEKTKKDMTN